MGVIELTEAKGRHELKHYINFSDLLLLRSKLPYVMSLDKNVSERNSYSVKSLYFDNYNDKALKEKIDGVNNREKFRLRLYNNDTSFIRLEKKSKINGYCYKESVRLTLDECQRLLDDDISVLKENGKKLCLELYSKMNYQQLRPKNIVDYQREAYIFSMGNVRITLDYDIRTSNNVKDFLNPNLIPLPINGVYILEVKYDNYLPEIVRGIVSLSSRRSTAFSKYAIARMV